jgi:predicted TIM-barrel fold metal-dependent hydrolase
VIIDFHAHYWPAAYLDQLERFGGNPSYQRRQLWASDTEVDLGGRLRMMDDAQVDVQILSPGGPQPYFAAAADAAASARLANDLYRDLVDRHPDRFGAFGMVPLPHVDPAIEEASRALDELDAAGITIGTSVLGTTIADPALDPFYAELDRRGAVLYVHPSGAGAGSALVSAQPGGADGRHPGQKSLTWVVGAPLEDTIAAANLIFEGVTVRFPNIKVLVSHHGGALPVLLGRLDFLYTDEMPPMEIPPSVLARRMWFDSVAHGDLLAIETARRAYGDGRLVLGSDFPYQLDADYTDSVDFLFRSGIGEDGARAILSGNAEGLLGDWLAARVR